MSRVGSDESEDEDGPVCCTALGIFVCCIVMGGINYHWGGWKLGTYMLLGGLLPCVGIAKGPWSIITGCIVLLGCLGWEGFLVYVGLVLEFSESDHKLFITLAVFLCIAGVLCLGVMCIGITRVCKGKPPPKRQPAVDRNPNVSKREPDFDLQVDVRVEPARDPQSNVRVGPALDPPSNVRIEPGIDPGFGVSIDPPVDPGFDVSIDGNFDLDFDFF